MDQAPTRPAPLTGPRNVARTVDATGPTITTDNATRITPTRTWVTAASSEAGARYSEVRFDAVASPPTTPLYHLLDRADRLAAWREAYRIVRPGGRVFAAAISRFASLHDGLTRQFLFDPDFAAIVADDLESGRHQNPDRQPGWFTSAYFHHPTELAEEATEAGFDAVALLGIEGLAGWLSHLSERLSNDTDRQTILDAARSVESEPALLGVSAHLLAVAERAR